MARAVSESLSAEESRECFIRAGLRALREHGPAALTVRKVAELAGASTMGIYTRFGGRRAMVEAIYGRGFESLRDALRAVTPTDDPGDDIVALATAYREFALANPSLYALMFERPLRDFDPSPQARSAALDMTFGILTDQVSRAQRAGLVADDDPRRAAYLLWTTMHGITSIELTHAHRSPLPGWFVDTPEAGEAVLRQGIRTALDGMTARRDARSGATTT